jgi:hypothetical protein
MAISGAPFSDTKNGSWDSGRGHSHHRHPWADPPSQPVFGSTMKTPQPMTFWYRTKAVSKSWKIQLCGISWISKFDIFLFAANLRLDAPHHWLLYHWLFQLSGSVLKLRGWWISSTSKPLLFMRFYVIQLLPQSQHISTALPEPTAPPQLLTWPSTGILHTIHHLESQFCSCCGALTLNPYIIVSTEDSPKTR